MAIIHIILQIVVTIGILFVFWTGCKDKDVDAFTRFASTVFFALTLIATWWTT